MLALTCGNSQAHHILKTKWKSWMFLYGNVNQLQAIDH